MFMLWRISESSTFPMPCINVCVATHKGTLTDIVPSAIEPELARREWHERLAERAVTDLGDSAASLLAEERQERRHDLAGHAT